MIFPATVISVARVRPGAGGTHAVRHASAGDGGSAAAVGGTPVGEPLHPGYGHAAATRRSELMRTR